MPVLCGKRGPIICQFCVGREDCVGRGDLLYASSGEVRTYYMPVLCEKLGPIICQFCVGRTREI